MDRATERLLWVLFALNADYGARPLQRVRRGGQQRLGPRGLAAAARYGEFRVAEDGEAILTRLRDPGLKPL